MSILFPKAEDTFNEENYSNDDGETLLGTFRILPSWYYEPSDWEAKINREWGVEEFCEETSEHETEINEEDAEEVKQTKLENLKELLETFHPPGNKSLILSTKLNWPLNLSNLPFLLRLVSEESLKEPSKQTFHSKNSEGSDEERSRIEGNKMEEF